MLRTRILAAAVFTPFVFLALYFGGWYLFALCSIIAVFALWETATMTLVNQRWDKAWSLSIGLFLYAAITFSWFHAEVWLLVLALLFVVCALLIIFNPLPLEQGIARLGSMVITIVYGGVLISFLYLLRQGADGLYWSMTALFCVWGCDTGAYFSGRFLGKHKMAKNLSPKKTIEGFIGGVISAVGVAALTYYLFHPSLFLGLSMVIGGVTGAFGQFGDLTESLIKRSAGVKDSGKIIPGHGGVLDRFDAVIFVAPVLYAVRFFL